MNKMRPNTAKILVHSEGLGTPYTDLVRKRAQEIAVINGRTEFSEEDWRQAKIELHGCHGPDNHLSDEMAMAAMVSEQGMVASDVGHQADHVDRHEDRGQAAEEAVQVEKPSPARPLPDQAGGQGQPPQDGQGAQRPADQPAGPGDVPPQVRVSCHGTG